MPTLSGVPSACGKLACFEGRRGGNEMAARRRRLVVGMLLRPMAALGASALILLYPFSNISVAVGAGDPAPPADSSGPRPAAPGECLPPQATIPGGIGTEPGSNVPGHGVDNSGQSLSTLLRDCRNMPTRADREGLIAASVSPRTDLGFTATIPYIAAIVDEQLATGDFSSWVYGGAFTQSEVEEIKERLVLQREHGPVDAAASSAPTYAGSYVDHSAGGLLVLQFTDDPANHVGEFDSLLTDSSRIRIDQVAYDLAELRATEDAIFLGPRPAAISLFTIQTSAIDFPHNRVHVGIAENDPAAIQAFANIYGNRVSVELNVQPALPADCTQTSCTSIVGGLEIIVYPRDGEGQKSLCTVGYVATEDFSGGVRVTTAGHCKAPEDPEGTVGQLIAHDGRRIGTGHRNDWTPNDTGRGQITDAMNFFTDTDIPSVAQILRANIGGGLANVVDVDRRRNMYSHYVCISGVNNPLFEVWFGIRCGVVVISDQRVNHSGRCDLPLFSNCTYSQSSVANIPVSGGDSGGPVYGATDNQFNVVAKGLTSASESGGTRTRFMPIVDVEQRLGVHVRTK